ncbi:hypothetical protein CDL15_Pgr018888 [Punica granatum]|nr:hypothetical protein CDL15_Pgr018888 [Punica granatum]
MRAELRAIREERDRLRCELVDSRAEVADYRELQTELAPVSAPHFGPPASYTRIPDQNSSYYSSPDNQRRTCGHGDMNYRRKAGCTRKAEESRREQSEEFTDKEPRKQRNRHCGTIHH